jgi:hypothetical protein
MDTETKRVLVVGGLLYAAWTTWTCPCKDLLSCHKTQFYVSMALPLALVALG